MSKCMPFQTVVANDVQFEVLTGRVLLYLDLEALLGSSVPLGHLWYVRLPSPSNG